MEEFEAWLRDHEVAIVGQAATGSGDLVRYQLQSAEGQVFDLVVSLEALVERPDEAIARVEEVLRLGRRQRRSNGL